MGVGRLLWRLLDLAVAGIFIFAALAKILDLDQLGADLQHLRLVNAFADIGHLSLTNPAEFAYDIDNFKILPWTIGVGLAFYLPWVELFAGIALILRRFYRGALSILLALIVIFIAATIAAKARGLDITCGCFGHASQHWSFPAHMAVDLAILAAVLLLLFKSANENRPVA